MIEKVELKNMARGWVASEVLSEIPGSALPVFFEELGRAWLRGAYESAPRH